VLKSRISHVSEISSPKRDTEYEVSEVKQIASNHGWQKGFKKPKKSKI
jgi:hypothetical protein